MSIDRDKIVRRILIGSIVFVSLSILIIIIYLLYRYRQKLFYFRQNLNDKQINIIHNEQIIDPLININNQKKSINNETTSTIIEELMRKSLQLAKTAEKVADEKEKRITLKDNIHFNLHL